MTALRPALASVLLAVLAVGGVVLPSVHHAAHGLEVADARAAHAVHHGDAIHGDAVHAGIAQGEPQRGETLAEAPCPPAPNDLDCAVCIGLSAAADLAVPPDPFPEDDPRAYQAYADWVRTVATTGAGARAPPIG